MMRMNKVLKWLAGAVFALGLLLAMLVAAASWWLSGDGLRTQLQGLASARLGVPVKVDKLSLAVWPLPVVAVEGIAVQTQPPLLAERLELQPAWAGLLGLGGSPRQLEIRSMLLEGVSLPQRGLDQLQQSLSKKERSAQIPSKAQPKLASSVNAAAEAGSSGMIAVGLLAIPQQLDVRRLVWQSTAGESLSVSGGLRANDARDEITLDLNIAGGTLRGPLRLSGLPLTGASPAGAGAGKAGVASLPNVLNVSNVSNVSNVPNVPNVHLRGELTTRGVSLAALPGMGARVSGSLQASTTLEAQATAGGQWWTPLGAALQTRTQFNVSGAVIKGVDLVKAVTTLGLSRGGETALQQLSGTLTTRGTGAAMQLSLRDLQAKSQLLSASGAVNVGAAASAGAARGLSGRVSVDLTAGDSVVPGAGAAMGALVGIPLEISGTTANPQVRPTQGAMIGGAIGSVMAPVIGTGAGAKLGDKAATTLSNLKEKLFGK
jgi:hypothetical protein